MAGDVVDAAGNINGAAYRVIASQFSQDAGIAYRYGPDASAYGVGSGGIPSLFKRQDIQLGGAAPAYAFFWQVGGPPSGDAGAYSTNQANMLFVADNPSQHVGVTDFQVSGHMYNTFAQSPQLSWTETVAPSGGLDSINIAAYRSTGIVTGHPVAVGRCGGRAGFCAQSLVAFQNGLIATAGSNTAGNRTTVQLPANKVPTGIAMTNDSEFALVTIWDTTALKGQVAVIALAGLCDGCSPYSSTSPRAYYDWWHEWMAPYPGLPNMGDIAFMKILGYVDLPEIAAPTEIAVTTGLDPFRTMMSNGDFIGLGTPLTNQANRQSFLPGGVNYGRYAKGGVAVVISKSERKAAFIDLKPLFAYINNMYFGVPQSDFGAAMANLGPMDAQWPYTFAQEASQMPKVIETISLAAAPTAVRTTVFGATPRAWVATQDGTLHIFSLDGYAPGAAASSPTASAIAEVGVVGGLGRNPTSLAISKGEPDDGSIEPINQQVLAASRGDRRISWVRFTADGNSGSVARTLQDARLVDPIAVEDADNFANVGYVLSVADYGGRAVRNFRYGPVVFADGGACPPPNGCPVIPTNGIRQEFGGSMDLPGAPFQLSTANVP